MNTLTRNRPSRAFTLVELLIVISIIGVLAALLFPVGKSITQKGARARARTELEKVASAIESYKSKLGHYPPGNVNTNLPATNQLYFELVGCRSDSTGTAFQTLDGAVTVSATDLNNWFGTPGIVNSSAGGNSDEAATAQPFLREIKPAQYGVIAPGIRALGVLLDGPVMFPSSSGQFISPFSYNSSNPSHNVNSFDLWVDVKIGGKTNRINNWSDQYEIVP